MSTKKTTVKAKTPAVKKEEEKKTPEVTTAEEQTPQTPEASEEAKAELTNNETADTGEEENATPEDPQLPKEEEDKPDETPEPKVADDVIGSLKGGKQVHQKIKTVRIKAMRGPISKRELPKDIQRWLTNKGYGTNVYLQPKEWLKSHNVDMKMVEKLKKFINDKYL